MFNISSIVFSIVFICGLLYLIFIGASIFMDPATTDVTSDLMNALISISILTYLIPTVIAGILIILSKVLSFCLIRSNKKNYEASMNEFNKVLLSEIERERNARERSSNK